MVKFSFLATKWKSEIPVVRKSPDCDNRAARNWSGYLYDSSQTHFEKSRRDFLSLRGKAYLKAKTFMYATSEKIPSKETALLRMRREYLNRNFRGID